MHTAAGPASLYYTSGGTRRCGGATAGEARRQALAHVALAAAFAKADGDCHVVEHIGRTWVVDNFAGRVSVMEIARPGAPARTWSRDEVRSAIRRTLGR